MSLYAITQELRAAAAILDPITKTLILARRDEATAGEPMPVSPGAYLVDAGIDVAAEPDALAIMFLADELDRYANPVKPRVYLCHPFSAVDTSDSEKARAEEAENIQNTLRWLQWFVDNTTWAIGAPWIPYVMALSESTYRERGIEDDKSLIEGHTLLVCVSNRKTSGMVAEFDHAKRCGIAAMDLTGIQNMTFEPPLPGSELAVLLRQVIEMIAPGTVRPVDAFGVPIPQGARPRVDGCTSAECSIRNACTKSGGCGQEPV